MSNSVRKLKSPYINLIIVFIMLQSPYSANASVYKDNQTSPWHTRQELELTYEYERNFNLDDKDKDNAAVLEPELKLSFAYAPSRLFQALVRLELGKKYRMSGSGAETKPTQLEITELYLLSEGIDVPGGGEISLQIGRQRFDDERQWLYDEQLDGLRVFYDYARWHSAVSITRERNKEVLRHKNKKETDNYMISTRYSLDNHVLGGYILKREQRKEGDERPLFVGLRAGGKIADHWQYWLELARVEGRDGSRDIRGWGGDVGAIYTFDHAVKPMLILGYAFGTGDTGADNDVNRAFRQTGLQDNEQNFDGTMDFRYHGVLLEPELSNMNVFTVGAGIRPNKRFSSYLLYHTYHQDKARDDLRDTNLDTDPNGTHRDLGSEVDWVMGADLTDSLEMELVLGYFMPGAAFDAPADNALFLGLEFEYNF